MAYTADSKSVAFGLVGSSPTSATSFMNRLVFLFALLSLPAFAGTDRASFTVSVNVVRDPSRAFVQYCAVCHTKAELQNASRQIITKTLSSPQHKMVLTDSQINDIVLYLQTYY